MNKKDDNLDTIEKLDRVYELVSFDSNKSIGVALVQYMHIVKTNSEINKMIKNIKKRNNYSSNNLFFSKKDLAHSQENNLLIFYDLLMEYYNFYIQIKNKFKNTDVNTITKQFNSLRKTSQKFDLFKILLFVHKSLIYHIKEERLNIKADKIIKQQDPYFDENTGILFINEYEIKIKERKNDTNSLQILKYIFDNKLFEKKINWNTIMEEVFGDSLNDNYRKCETAFLSLQKKVIKETDKEITDFFEVKTGKNCYIKVNNKYFTQFN